MSSISTKSKASSNSNKSKNKNNSTRKRPKVNIEEGTKKQKRSVSKLDRYSMVSEARPPSSPYPAKNNIFRQPDTKFPPNSAPTSPEYIHHDLSKHDSYMDSFDCHQIYPVPSILYNNDHLVFQSNQTLHYQIFENSFPEGDQTQRLHIQSPPDLAREFDSMLGVPLADPSSMMNEQHIEWSGLSGSVDNTHFTACVRQKNDKYVESLMQKLNVVHKKIIDEWIGCRPRSERGRLVSVVANWARCLSQSPLQISVPDEGHQEQREHATETSRKNASLKIEDWDLAVSV